MYNPLIELYAFWAKFKEACGSFPKEGYKENMEIVNLIVLGHSSKLNLR